jgi:hypothetical protein
MFSVAEAEQRPLWLFETFLNLAFSDKFPHPIGALEFVKI